MSQQKKSDLPYCISFNTLEMPGKIVAVQVILRTYIMGDKDEVRVDLIDHPLYPQLEQYVLANQKGKRNG